MDKNKKIWGFIYIFDINNKKYIGKTAKIKNGLKRRFNEHFKEKKNPYFHNSLRKHFKSGDFRVLEGFYETTKKLKLILNKREKFWIEKYDTFDPEQKKGWNLTKGGDGNWLGWVPSEETKNKMRIKKLGTHQSEEHKLHMRETFLKKYKYNHKTINCKNCGKEFIVVLSNVGKVFCSNECRKKYSENNKEIRICPICKKEFKINKLLHRVWCSKECKLENSKNYKEIRICKGCKKEFLVYKANIGTKFCSKECHKKYYEQKATNSIIENVDPIIENIKPKTIKEEIIENRKKYYKGLIKRNSYNYNYLEKHI